MSATIRAKMSEKFNASPPFCALANARSKTEPGFVDAIPEEFVYPRPTAAEKWLRARAKVIGDGTVGVEMRALTTQLFQAEPDCVEIICGADAVHFSSVRRNAA
jgi:hypothetical protein